MDGIKEQIGQFEFSVATCEPSPEARERWANRVDTLTRWLLAQWNREHPEQAEDGSAIPEPSMN
jgi:hypothetical protein